MDKRVLLIINPRSGTMHANKHLTEITEVFVRAGYLPTVLVTTQRGDGTAYVKRYGAEMDLIVGIGGDGTFNEVAAGVVELGLQVPVGYIPAGSTNDFAMSLGLVRDVIQNAKNIVRGERRPIDLGCFNGRTFSYVACFGAFTKASYATPQNIKNALGHLAYILSGVREVKNLRPIPMRITADGVLYEGDYLFGAITNSTSIAGLVTLKKEYVDMSDGMFEMLLVKAPKDPIQLAELLRAVTSQDFYENSHLEEMITFINAREFHIETDAGISWSLDGEYQEGCRDITITNLHSAIEMMLV